MKLSNKFALISSVASILIGIPLLLSSVFWTIPLKDYTKTLTYLSITALILTGLFYLYQENRLRKAIENERNNIVFDTPLVAGVHAALNFTAFIIFFSLIMNPLFELTTIRNLFRIGFLLIPVGLIQLGFIYYISFTTLAPYYKTLEETKFMGLNITKKVLIFGIPALIFSVFTGYILTKTWFGLLYLIFPSLIIFILIKIIKKPIDDLQNRIQNILNEPSPSLEKTKIVSGDEITLINDSISLFLEKTISLITGVKDTADKVRTQGEAILSGIKRLSSSSKQINDSVQDILEKKQESVSIVNSVQKNDQELSSLSSEIESQIKTLVNTSKKSIELANSGEEESEEGVNKINDFVQKIEEGSKSLENLSSAFEEIKEFNSLMEQISDDTNLLALNASIEATRKEGEESKGFSVIADEIRKLSNDSASYLEKTKENIKRMNEAVKSIVESTEKSISIFEESKSIIQKAAEDLKEISESIGLSTNMADQISEILKEETDSIEEIKKSAKKLSLLNDKQSEAALTLSKETGNQITSIEDTEIRAQTLISLIDKIKEKTNLNLE